MEGAGAIGVAFIALVVLGVVVISLRRQRKRAAAVDLEDTSWLRRAPVEPDPIAKRLAVADFHIHGSEARVVFDVPLPEENDPILNDLLVDEMVVLEQVRIAWVIVNDHLVDSVQAIRVTFV